MEENRIQKYTWNKCYLVWVSFLDFMGLGVVVAIFPHMLLRGHLLPASWTHQMCLIALGILLAAYPFGQFLAASVLGKMSDIYGRKPIILLTLMGTLLAFIASAVAVNTGSAGLLLASRVCAGLCAGNVAVAQACMADISPSSEKAKNLSLIQVVLGLAWVFGPPLGGWVCQFSIGNGSGFATPFWLVSGLFTASFIYAFFLFSETLQSLQPKQALNIFSGLTQIREAFTRPHLRCGFYVWAIFVAGWWLFEAFLPALLLQNFGFSSEQIGQFLASMGATYAVFQYVVVNRITKYISPQWMVKGFLPLAGLSILSIIFSHNTIFLHIAITFFVTAMGFVLPGLMTSLSNLENTDNQGKIMGNIFSVQALSTVLMMILGGFLNQSGIHNSVIGGAVLILISWVLFILFFKNRNVI